MWQQTSEKQFLCLKRKINRNNNTEWMVKAENSTRKYNYLKVTTPYHHTT